MFSVECRFALYGLNGRILVRRNERFSEENMEARVPYGGRGDCVRTSDETDFVVYDECS